MQKENSDKPSINDALIDHKEKIKQYEKAFNNQPSGRTINSVDLGDFDYISKMEKIIKWYRNIPMNASISDTPNLLHLLPQAYKELSECNMFLGNAVGIAAEAYVGSGSVRKSAQAAAALYWLKNGTSARDPMKRPSVTEADQYARVICKDFDEAEARYRGLYIQAQNLHSANERYLAVMNKHIRRIEAELNASELNNKQFLALHDMISELHTNIQFLNASNEELQQIEPNKAG